MLKLHNKLSYAVSSELPRFPPKKIGGGAHLVDMALVADRVTELQTYFTELLKQNPQVLKFGVFYDELGMTAAAKKDKKVAFLKQALEQYGRKFPEEKKRPRDWILFGLTQQASLKGTKSVPKPTKEVPSKKQVPTPAPTQEQISDYLYAQRFHLLAKPGAGIPGLYYKHAISFELGEMVWTKEDRTIREKSCKRIWFSFAGPIPSAAAGWERSHTDDCYAVVNAAASVPLLYIGVPKAGHSSPVTIFEAMADGKVGPVLCGIERKERVTMCVDGRSCVSTGQWDGTNNFFELRQSADSVYEEPSASVKWKTKEDGSQTISVFIKQNRDVLFYLGAIIGIDFMNTQQATQIT